MRVLIVEDHADIAESVGEYLEERGHVVDYARDGLAALRLATQETYDVVVLDRLLPRMDGATLCARLRGEHGLTAPVLMLTALDTVNDKVAGFEAGADDYLVKPFELAELYARLTALHRRASNRVASSQLSVGDLVLHTRTRELRRAGQLIALSPTLAKLLEHLMRNGDRIVPREELEYLLWGEEPPDQDFLRAHMHKLRDAIDREHPRKLLHTFRGIGYRLADLEQKA
ncbi:DNA-binding response regulator [Solimonas sp. K1W22B-7]|uniref:response regulator transcription factor n=1 Tax=Solimonas sp. K1W22B-7 TaxID=2303331 RepID=UPI000E33242B|nr:response regulator transcription factor [Solimonas sp. K1W22B-7]AXQ29947.1 DNA-binding response regulator [Solimonas sp. K1W22B-7]